MDSERITVLLIYATPFDGVELAKYTSLMYLRLPSSLRRARNPSKDKKKEKFKQRWHNVRCTSEASATAFLNKFALCSL